jgi:hypothetical protein
MPNTEIMATSRLSAGSHVLITYWFKTALHRLKPDRLAGIDVLEHIRMLASMVMLITT